jgi:CheY-like chemotaxis protein
MKRVWIIDDDAITRFLIKRTLSKAPFEIESSEFADGEIALEGIRACAKTPENLPDIVLLDLNMPLMDGWDFLRELKNQYVKDLDKIQFLILTSSMDPKDEAKGKMNQLVRAFLRKPLNLNEFLSAIDVEENTEGKA